MNQIPLFLPTGAEASNYLYPQMDLDDLTQDILTVKLPSGYFVDVGWYPEHDPKGRFVVRVFKEYWDCQELDPPFTTQDVGELITAVERLAWSFNRREVPVSQTGEERQKEPSLVW